MNQAQCAKDTRDAKYRAITLENVKKQVSVSVNVVLNDESHFHRHLQYIHE